MSVPSSRQSSCCGQTAVDGEAHQRSTIKKGEEITNDMIGKIATLSITLENFFIHGFRVEGYLFALTVLLTPHPYLTVAEVSHMSANDLSASGLLRNLPFSDSSEISLPVCPGRHWFALRSHPGYGTPTVRQG